MRKRIPPFIIVALLSAGTTYAVLHFFDVPITFTPQKSAIATDHTKANDLATNVRAIMKLVVVQGAYEEFFTERDAKVIPEVLGKLGFKKKAMLRVKGRVTVGYTFDEGDVVVDELARKLTLKAPIDPDILAIEHDVDYLDLDEGLFNKFNERELTAINAKGKERIRDKALKSDLFDQARSQRGDVVQVVRNFVISNGWDLVVDSTEKPMPGLAQR